MSEEKKVATPEEAAEYIESHLVSSELIMKEACEDLGWSFPRIRSKAITICKKLNGIFTKKERGRYILVQKEESKEDTSTPPEALESPSTETPTSEQLEPGKPIYSSEE